MSSQPRSQNGSAAAARSSMITGKFVRNAWYVAAWADELAEGKLVGRTILGEPVMVYRKADGSVVALEDRCPSSGG